MLDEKPKSSLPDFTPKESFKGEIIEIEAPVQSEEELRKIEELKKLKALKKAEKKKKKEAEMQAKQDALPQLAPLQMKRQGGFEIPDFLQ